MKATGFKGWFAKLPSLNQPQRRQVLDALHPAAGLDQVVALITEVRATRIATGTSSPTTCSAIVAVPAAAPSTT
jgi:hypothetical protein